MFSDKITYGIIAFIVLIIVYYFMIRSENYAETQKPSFQVPSLYDRKTGEIVTGSEFLGVPDEVEPAWGAKFGESDKLNKGIPGMASLNYNMCSKSCCSAQYPPPFPIDQDVVVDKMKKDDKFVPSSYMCNNTWQNSGCVCMTDQQSKYLGSRGTNN